MDKWSKGAMSRASTWMIERALWLGCAMTALACSPADDFCRPAVQCVDCADAGVVEDESCVSFDEAEQLAQRPGSGLRKLTGNATGGGVVTVVSQNAQTICRGTTCYLRRTGEVELYAAPGPSSLFVGWSGCSTSTEQRIAISNLRADAVCTAQFAPRFIVINTGVTGWYRARVSIDQCPGAQACAVEYGGDITLRAPTSDSYRFLSWSCAMSTDPTLALTDVRSVLPPCIAQFAAVTRDVSWEVASDTPFGSVQNTSGPDFVCDATHCAVVLHQQIHLQAVPDDGATFVGWSGCSTSSEPSLMLQDVTEDHHCVARFAR
jgi:hypothetical protein